LKVREAFLSELLSLGAHTGTRRCHLAFSFNYNLF